MRVKGWWVIYFWGMFKTIYYLFLENLELILVLRVVVAEVVLEFAFCFWGSFRLLPKMASLTFLLQTKNPKRNTPCSMFKKSVTYLKIWLGFKKGIFIKICKKLWILRKYISSTTHTKHIRTQYYRHYEVLLWFRMSKWIPCKKTFLQTISIWKKNLYFSIFSRGYRRIGDRRKLYLMKPNLSNII